MRNINIWNYQEVVSNPNYRKWVETGCKDKKPESEYITVQKPKLKVRIMSDLHLDFNYKYPLKLEDSDVLTVLAGDISGYYDYSSKWIKDNIKNGLFVEGNHVFYNDENKSLQQYYDRLKNEYPLENNISFLQNSHKEIDGVVFVGCTLWTDCRLNGICQTRSLEKAMNDYVYGKYEDVETGEIRKITPEDTIYEFEQSLKYIEQVCDENIGKKVVVITHHCPSEECLSPYYRSYNRENYNQGYASNLESFIKSHSNIVCWICGHSHNQCDFEIDGCRVVMNCRGYVKYGESEGFNPEMIIEI